LGVRLTECVLLTAGGVSLVGLGAERGSWVMCGVVWVRLDGLGRR
jgi:hypothetical protein